MWICRKHLELENAKMRRQLEKVSLVPGVIFVVFLDVEALKRIVSL